MPGPDAGTKAPAWRPFTWDVPGLRRQVQVGDVLWIRGMPTSLYAASSSWKVDALIDEYWRRFVRAGFFVPDSSKPLPGLPLPRVTAVDPRTDVVYTVLLMAEADGSTTLFLAAGSPRLRAPAESKAGLPLFPGAKHVFDAVLEGVPSVSYSVKAKPDEVLRFYEDTLTRAGYRKADAPNVWEKGQEQLRVVVGEAQNGLVPVAVVRNTAPAAPKLE